MSSGVALQEEPGTCAYPRCNEECPAELYCYGCHQYVCPAHDMQPCNPETGEGHWPNDPEWRGVN